MARVTWREDRGSWYVEWKERRVLVVGGAETTTWAKRSRKVPSKAAADALARDIETTAALGQRWTAETEMPTCTIEDMVLRYLASAIAGGAPQTTTRSRGSYLSPFVKRYGRRLVSELSAGLLEEYARSLPTTGRKAETRYRLVTEAELAWRYAWDMEIPDVPPPRRVTGTGRPVRRPPPVVATAAPTWEDVDRMLAALTLTWHRRAGLVMRYHALRASQVCGLRWADLDLRAGLLHIRAHRTGAKRGRGRVAPLAPPLLAELQAWPQEGELLFPRRYTDPETGEPYAGPYRGDALVGPFRSAWATAKVPEKVWGAPDEETRGHSSPTHAIRRAVKTGLLRLGVESAVADYFVGHSRGSTDAAYVPQDSPEQSPWWPRLLEAVAKIPPHPPEISQLRDDAP